jgi:hypothetical protein
VIQIILQSPYHSAFVDHYIALGTKSKFSDNQRLAPTHLRVSKFMGIIKCSVIIVKIQLTNEITSTAPVLISIWINHVSRSSVRVGSARQQENHNNTLFKNIQGYSQQETHAGIICE